MRALRTAVVSADAKLRAAAGASERVAVVTEIPLAAPEVGLEEVEALESQQPDLVLVDLADDPELSLRLVQHLVDTLPGRPILVIGPPPSAPLLLDAMRAGAAEYVPQPVTAETLDEVVDRVARRYQPAVEEAPRRQGCVHVFMGVKGGVGCTTIAGSVAVALRERTGERVILLDLDFGLGDAALHLGSDPQYDVVDVTRRLDRMDAGLLASLVTVHPTGVHLLPSPTSMERIESVATGQVQELMQFLRTQYDYVIVDAPHPFTTNAGEMFAEADRVLLVTTPEVAGLRNVEYVLPLVRRQNDGGVGKVELVVNRFEAARSIPVAEIERLVGVEVRATISNDYEVVTRFVSEGRPVVRAGRTPVARDLDRLAAGLVESRTETMPAPESPRRSFLQSLRRRAERPGEDGIHEKP